MERNITIHFENAAAMVLYFMEMEGQLSDGKYENSRPSNHWMWTGDVKNVVIDGETGMEGDLCRRGYYAYGNFQRHYNLNEWFSKYIRNWRKDHDDDCIWATRIIAYGKFGHIYNNLSMADTVMLSYARYFLETLQIMIENGENNAEILFNKLTDFTQYAWRKDYYEKCKDYINLDFIKKFLEMNYDINECKADCRSMYESINTVYNWKNPERTW